MKPIVSPRELAEAVGVSESSLKRWSDEGVIRVSKTAGGHRRIAIAEAIRFVRSLGLPLVKPEALGLSDLPMGATAGELAGDAADALFEHLAAGRAREARGLLVGGYLSGCSIAELGDGMIRGAFERLGELWKHETDGVFIEHRATDIVAMAVQEIRLLLNQEPAGRCALGGAISGDPYLLPSLLAATALLAEGMRAVNLGPDTPYAALLSAWERHDPALVWVSVSTVADARGTEEALKRVVEALAQRGTYLAIGGRCMDSLGISKSRNVRRCRGLCDLVEWVQELPQDKTGVTGPLGPLGL